MSNEKKTKRLYDRKRDKSTKTVLIDGNEDKDVQLIVISPKKNKYTIHFIKESTIKQINKNRVQIVSKKELTKSMKRKIDYFYNVAKYIDNIGYDEEEKSQPFYYKKCLDNIQPLNSNECLTWYLDKAKEQKNDVKIQSKIYLKSKTTQQIKAVDNALMHQVTLIDAPPRTGKLDVVLDMAINVILSGKTVAIVSENVELLKEYHTSIKQLNIDGICAPFYSKESYADFYEVDTKQSKTYKVEKKSKKVSSHEIRELIKILNENKMIEQEYNLLSERLRHLEDEAKYFKFFSDEFNKYDDQQLFEDVFSDQSSQPNKFSSDDFIIDNAIDSLGQSTTSRFFKYLSRYKILNFKKQTNAEDVTRWLNIVYEEKYLNEITYIKTEIKKIRQLLKNIDLNEVKQSLEKLSGEYTENYLTQHFNKNKNLYFNAGDEVTRYALFSREYPILISRPSALTEFIPSGSSVDVVIVDEAEKLSLIPGIFALAKAKSLVVIGDSHYEQEVFKKSESYQLPKIEKEYDYFSQTLFSSIETLIDESEIVSLNELVSGQPYILDFLNRFFFDNELSISYTRRPNSYSLGMFFFDSRTHIDSKLENVSLTRKLAKRKLSYSLFDKVYELNQAKNIRIMTPFQKSPFQTNEIKKCSDDAVVFATEVSRGDAVYYRKLGEVSSQVYEALARANRLFVLGVASMQTSIEDNALYALQGYINYFGQYELSSGSYTYPVFEWLYHYYYEYYLENVNKFTSSQEKLNALAKVKSEINQSLSFISDVKLQAIVLYPLHGLVRKYSQLESWEREYIREGDYCDVLIYDSYWKKVVGIVEMQDYDGFSDRELLKVETRASIYDKLEIPHITVSISDSDVRGDIATFMSQLPRIKL